MKNIQCRILIYCWGAPLLLLLSFLGLLFFAGKSHILTGSTAGMLAAIIIRSFIIRRKFLYSLNTTEYNITIHYFNHFIRMREIVFDKESITITSVNETNRWPGNTDTILIADNKQSIHFIMISKKLHQQVLQQYDNAI